MTREREPRTMTALELLRADQARLLFAASESDANMLYATGFFVPDPFIFFQHNKRNYHHCCQHEHEEPDN